MGKISFYKIFSILGLFFYLQTLYANRAQNPLKPRREVLDRQVLLDPPATNPAPSTAPVVTTPAVPQPQVPREPSATVVPPKTSPAPSTPQTRATPVATPHTPTNNGGTDDRISPPKVPGSIEAPAKPEGISQGQKTQNQDAVVALAERIADLFACLPGHKDALYSTQSWHVVDTFTAWNNAAAESIFLGDANATDIKQTFENAAIEKIKSRNPALANDPSVLAYFKSAAQAADSIFKKATSSKEKIDSFAKGDALVKSSSRVSGKNIYQHLKTAHSAHVDTLKGNTCAQLGKSFFSTPKFNVPSTEASRVAVRNISERPQSLTQSLAAQSAQEKRDALVNAKYPANNSISTQLPVVSYADRNKAGYFTAGQFQTGRPHIIGNILKAADRLKQENISMGVAIINQAGNPTDKKVKTPGYKGYDEGKRASFMLIDPSGNPSTCGFDSSTCYDPEKTFKMLTALVDADPDNIKKIEVDDVSLKARLEDYLVKNHNYKRISAEWIIKRSRDFDNLVTMEWKK